ncbi:hypothetical protein [Escherichia coli]|uniref:hypothetical protein n=1 Tax=Escherichia coli TaxID=562 RepID=UPI002FCCDF9D
MQTFSETDLRDAQALLPDSVQQLISVIGFPRPDPVDSFFWWRDVTAVKTGVHAERTAVSMPCYMTC